jgi:hypothetical protein
MSVLTAPTLTPAQRALWERLATELESGRRKRASRYLAELRYGRIAYCAEGVMCDLSGLGVWVPQAEGSTRLVYVINRESARLSVASTWCPEAVRAAYGVTSGYPWLPSWLVLETLGAAHPIWGALDQDCEVALSALNDSGVSFRTIAAMIRRFWLAES